MMSFGKNKFLLLFILLAGCRTGRVSFNPDFYVGDHATGSIVSERGDTVSADDPAFDEFACMHKTKIKELSTLLIRLKIPRGASLKSKVAKEYQNLVERMPQPLKE